MLVDIDRFKAVNDAHGHAAGDAVLREVAVRLPAGLREEDLAARWGGEEFLLLLPDSPDAGVVCERLRASIAEPPDQRPRRAAAGGLRVLRLGAWSGEETGEALVGRADVALYAAKDGGRDRVVAAAPAAVPTRWPTPPRPRRRRPAPGASAEHRRASPRCAPARDHRAHLVDRVAARHQALLGVLQRLLALRQVGASQTSKGWFDIP